MTHFGPTRIPSVTITQEASPRDHTPKVAPLEGNVTTVEVSLLRQAIMCGAHFLGLGNNPVKNPLDSELTDAQEATQPTSPSANEVSIDQKGLWARARSLIFDNPFGPTLLAAGEWATQTLKSTLAAIANILQASQNSAGQEVVDGSGASNPVPTPVAHATHAKAVTFGSSPIILDVIESKRPTDQELLKVAIEQTVEACRREAQEEKTEEARETRERQNRLDEARRVILEIDHRCGSNPNNPAVAQILASLGSTALDPIEPIEQAITRAIHEVEMLQRQEVNERDSGKKQDT